MELFALLQLVTACCCLFASQAAAQFAQDYIANAQAGTYSYAPIPNQVGNPVVSLGTVVPYLIYNCHYMRDICVNYQQFALSARGQALHPQSGLANDVFGYDFDTGDTLPRSHQDYRRDASCPTSGVRRWLTNHPCPETAQFNPMRNNGPWYTTLLDPQIGVPLFSRIKNLLQHDYDANGNIVEYSNIKYTCDEFPPATWVEGGNGWSGTTPANTRCAALACEGLRLPFLPVVKSEQNWQGLSHGVLRNQMAAAADTIHGQGTWDNPTGRRAVVHFRFATNNAANGIAARVYVVDQQATATVLQANVPIPQAKRAVAMNGTLAGPGLTVEQLEAYAQAGMAREILIHENLTISGEDPTLMRPDMASLPLTGISGMGLPPSWNFGDVATPRNATNVQSRSTMDVPVHPQVVPRTISFEESRPLIKRATPKDLAAARSLVEQALAASDKLNRARVANPRRNKYSLSPDTQISRRGLSSNGTIQLTDSATAPLLVITPEIAAAAALVAEAEVGGNSTIGGNSTNLTRRAAAASTGTFWMQSIARKGSVPWGNDPNYKVFRNVLDYGAVGDGVTDDTMAIMKAMGNTTRCARGCNGSTTKNAIVYFPPGNYLISSTIAMPFGTQVIGDANTRPTLVAAPSFVGLGVLSNDEYTGGDGGDQEYYINTSNFYRQIRNIVIDIRKVSAGALVTCIHYQVGQATSTQNVELIAQAGTEQIGMFAENGSGGSLTDITFTGGGVGLKGGSQQFTSQRLTFNGCDVGVQTIWDWGWVWKSITMTNVGVGFKLVGDGSAVNGNIGSISLLDSSFNNVKQMLVVKPITSSLGKGNTGISLENIALSGVGVAVADTSGATLLPASGSIDQWIVGPVYEGSAREFSQGKKVGQYRREHSLLDAKGNYFERARPQYEDQPASAFVHTKDLGCAGDGSTDDTAAFQAALYSSVGKILFVDAGTYILTSTVTIPPGSKIVGETWSQLAASGAFFSDASNPKVMLSVGNSGQVGSVEMQDLLFTTVGPTAGAVLVEWNLQASSQGAAGLWDCHARIGGATGTKLTTAECPPSTSGTDSGCNAGSLMMHLTKSGSGYFENMWLWVADHTIDDSDLVSPSNDMPQTSIYVARGFLIESTSASWLYGTASEHAVFYQYNFHAAKNLFAGMIQTESPYYQPMPKPPAPFANVVGKFSGDPDYTCASGNDFSGCDQSWSTIITGSENIFIAAAGLYSWFSTYTQTCIDTQQCQKALMLLTANGPGVRVTNLITIGAKYMVVMDGKGISAADNLNVNTHPDWSIISTLDVSSNGTTNFLSYLWIDPKIWDMDTPQVTCSAPCTIKIPPWTGATSTVNYPLVTVSQGTWTSTITKPPFAITEWLFEPVTVNQAAGNKAKRAAATTNVWPVPAKIPYWPAFVYTGGIDGKPTTTYATAPFPTPPASIGPNAPAPPSGSWPKRDLEINFGPVEGPLIDPCSFDSFYNPTCNLPPWFGYPNGSMGAGGGGGDVENVFDAWKCPGPRTKSSSSTTSTRTTTAISTPSPTYYYNEGDPRLNKVSCYGSGENTEGARMQNAAKSFCGEIAGDLLAPNYFHSRTLSFPYNGGIGSVDITISLKVKSGCSFGKLSYFNKRDSSISSRDDKFDTALCLKYLSVPTDSCNCAGVNGKQGGIVENNCYIWRIDPNVNIG